MSNESLKDRLDKGPVILKDFYLKLREGDTWLQANLFLWFL